MVNQILSKICKDTHSFRVFHSGKHLTKNHYDTLKLPKDCTNKQIREQFIKLSKESHPDKNKAKDAHTEFLKIKEAYSVLSKPHSRNSYDLRLKYEQFQNSSNFCKSYQRYHRKTEQNQCYQDRAYYGIPGLARLPNVTILLICLFASGIATTLQLLAIRRSLAREAMVLRSNEYQEKLHDIKQKAEVNGNETQIELLKKRLNVKDEND